MTAALALAPLDAPPLLGPDDPPPYTWVNPEGGAPALLVADHAGRAFPARLGRLGLDGAALDRHIAYDIGIAPLARRLAALLDAPAILHGYSRLIVDPNRRLDDPTAICPVSDGQEVPGNRDLAPADVAARVDALFRPYHDAIAEAIEARLARGMAPALISLHSFTPRLAGLDRPWHVGVLWNRDGRIALPLLARLAAEPGLVVGDNEPYDGRNLHAYTVPVHAGARGLANVLIEVRQDLIADAAGAAEWAERLARHLAPILAGLAPAP